MSITATDLATALKDYFADAGRSKDFESFLLGRFDREGSVSWWMNEGDIVVVGIRIVLLAQDGSTLSDRDYSVRIEGLRRDFNGNRHA